MSQCKILALKMKRKNFKMFFFENYILNYIHLHTYIYNGVLFKM